MSLIYIGIVVLLHIYAKLGGSKPATADPATKGGAAWGAVLMQPLRDDALLRVRGTAPQSRLDAVARHRNLRRAFAVRPDVPLPAHVALVDDVMTTGATLHAAADALLRAGVERVDAWVCARVA